MKRWRIIFYPHLHPKEPRAAGETQFTNKRIYVFTKHKRYTKLSAVEILIHETLHIFFRCLFHKENPADKALDIISYRLDKMMYRKKIVQEKGWLYYKKTRREKAFES